MATDPLPAPQAARRLTRSTEDKHLAGVSGGLARYFGVDPVLFRIAFGVSVFFGGIGGLAYLALYVYLPTDDGRPSFMERRSRAFKLGAALVLGLIAIGSLGTPGFLFGPGLAALAAFAAIALVLYKTLGGSRHDDPAQAIARALLVLIVLAAALGAATGIGILAALGGGVAMAIIAIAAGVSLIVAGLAGGPRWLILPVVVLILPLAVVSASGLDLRGGVGQHDYRPTSVAQLRPEYRIGAGRISLDLRGLDLPAGRTDVKLRVGVGEAVVTVPAGTCVSTDGRIGAGRADVPDDPDEGVDLDLGRPARAGAHVVHVTANLGAGHLQIDGACA